MGLKYNQPWEDVRVKTCMEEEENLNSKKREVFTCYFWAVRGEFLHVIFRQQERSGVLGKRHQPWYVRDGTTLLRVIC